MDKPLRPTAAMSMPHWPDLPSGEDPYKVLVDCVRDYAMFLLDREGHIRTWNAGAASIIGFAASEIVGHPFSELFTPAEIARGYPERALEHARQHGRFEDEGWRVRKDGMRFWAQTMLTALRDADGEVYGFAKVMRDLTERVQQQEALRRSEARSSALRDQAIRDSLTSAYNRRHLFEYLRESLDRAVLMTAALLMLDLDRFKEINDRYGHDTGDGVLVGFASLVRRLSRNTDLLYRLGGDEFLLYLPGADEAEARAIAERIRVATEQAGLLPSEPVTVSIGLATLKPEDSVETWMQAADAQLYEAKRSGRNRVC